MVRGDSVVLPFASEDGAQEIIRWLETGTGVFTWAFLYSSISLGLFRVESINNYSYVCSFQKRLNGKGPVEMDPMARLVQVNVDLDYTYGLMLTEGAVMNCQGWLGVDVQRCIVPLLQSSPLKRATQRSESLPSSSGSKTKRVQFEDVDEGEDDEPSGLSQRIKDSAGNALYVNKHQNLIPLWNRTILMRAVIPAAKRQVMFPEAFTLGAAKESAGVYLEPGYIFRQAETRSRANQLSVGMGDALVCKGKFYWGKFGDKEFLEKIALFTTEDFDSDGPYKLCMEHFSPDQEPTAIKDVDGLVRCLRGVFQTYDELWGVSWKRSLEATYVEYLERFELVHATGIDWHYASRVVLSFFHHLQEAARLPTTGISMMGQTAPVIKDVRIPTPDDWVPFMLEAFIPFCEGYFSTDQVWSWVNKKCSVPPQQFCRAVGKQRNVPGKGAGVVTGGQSSSSSSSSSGREKGKGGSTSGSPTLKFCIVDAFQYVGVDVDKVLEGKTLQNCGGDSCKFVHVSAGVQYIHKDVFVGVLGAISKMEKKVKTAWLTAMAGQGEKLFKKPFANKA